MFQPRSHNSLLLQTLIILTVGITLISGLDKTLEEREKGKDVVEAVVSKIRSSNIFTADYQLLRRIAYVETLDGESAGTYGSPAGIWNVPEVFLNRTKDQRLLSFHEKINSTWSINWAGTNWNDLLKPFYNGLAARMYIEYLNRTIPQTLKDQGWFWDQLYSRHDDWSNGTFVEKGEELENATVPCTGKMDLVIVLDGSGSVDPENFQRSKGFVVDLIGTYPVRKVRTGFVVFGSEAEEIFHLDNYKSLDELNSTVWNAPYPASKTNTNEALEVALSIFKKAEPRPDVPQVMIILTDGISNPQGVDNIQLLKDLGVVSYAIGITDLVDLDELEQLAYNIPGNVYSLLNFEVLQQFYGQLNSETCKIPQKSELESVIEDTVLEGEFRLYSFEVPSEGITISREDLEGSTTGFYSFSFPTPNSALNDGVLLYSETFIPIPKPPTFQQYHWNLDEPYNATVYISIQGLQPFNNYTMEVLIGDFADPTTTTKPTVPPTDPDAAASTSITGLLLFISILSVLVFKIY